MAERNRVICYGTGSIPVFTTKENFTPTFFDILKENTRDKYRNAICLFDKKVIKGARRMPWISEAKKDVISCDKLRGFAHKIRSGDFRMGKPNMLKAYYQNEANQGN